MVYRCYIETVKKDNYIGWAYTFYNHQDFMVYKRFGKTESADEEKVILETAVTALTYFEKSMRRRYYDEHFSTRIDEDYVTLFTQYSKIAETAKLCKGEETCSLGFVGEDKALWEALTPFFIQRTMMFENSSEERFISAAKEMASSAL